VDLRPEWSSEESQTLSASLSRIYPRVVPSASEIDWDRVLQLCIHFDPKFRRDAITCKIHYLHFLVPKRDWSADDDAKLAELVTSTGGTDWMGIASAFPGRTAFECYSRCYSSLHPVLVPSDFSPDDDNRLSELVAQCGDNAWTRVALEMGTGHTEAQLANRWNKTLKPGLTSGRWNPVLDARLCAAVKFYGVGKWSLIAKHVPGKTDRKCRERYMDHLAPGLKPPTEWEAEEDAQLLAAVKLHPPGNWAKVQQELPGRTDQMCRNRFLKIASDEEKAQYEQSMADKRQIRDRRTRNHVDPNIN
jgi:hypothetical protein